MYEKGAIKPVKPLGLPEPQKLRVAIDTAENSVAATTALIKTDAALVLHVVEGDEYLYDSSAPSCP